MITNAIMAELLGVSEAEAEAVAKKVYRDWRLFQAGRAVQYELTIDRASLDVAACRLIQWVGDDTDDVESPETRQRYSIAVLTVLDAFGLAPGAGA